MGSIVISVGINDHLRVFFEHSSNYHSHAIDAMAISLPQLWSPPTLDCRLSDTCAAGALTHLWLLALPIFFIVAQQYTKDGL